MESKIDRWIYVLLAAVWLGAAAWQYSAHQGVRTLLRADLRHRAEDISRAIAVVIRADGRFDAVPHHRVEAALEELTDSTDLLSVSLRDAGGNVTAQAGTPPAVALDDMASGQAYWLPDSAVFVNLVALGARAGGDAPEGRGPGDFRGDPRPLPRLRPPGGREGFQGEPGGGRPGEPGNRPPQPWEPAPDFDDYLHGRPLTDRDVANLLERFPGHIVTDEVRALVRDSLTGKVLTPELLEDLRMVLLLKMPDRGPRPVRSRWLDTDRARLLDKRGVHAFVLEIPAGEVYAAERGDRRTRLLIVALVAAVCAVILHLLRTMKRGNVLGLRLARSEAIAGHLKELNAAAAGLVHETKNPLNIIRGLAQLIGRDGNADPRGRETALRIVEEADRVTGRLNQFLDYSRPPAPRCVPVPLEKLVTDVFALLECDREDKQLAFEFHADRVDTVQADPDLFRQVLFNLLLNAIEATNPRGRIAIVAGRDRSGRAWLAVRDNGTGIDPALKDTLFQPYVTGTASGTGLGLTIVRQIALAHGWLVSAENNPDGGATFRIGRMEAP